MLREPGKGVKVCVDHVPHFPPLTRAQLCAYPIPLDAAGAQVLTAESEKLTKKRKSLHDAKQSEERRLQHMLRIETGATPAEKADNALVRLMATSGLPFRLAGMPCFKEYVRAVQAAGPTYSPCSRKQAAGPVLRRCAQLAGRVRDDALRVIGPEGGTLCSDGMKKHHRNLTQNVLCVWRNPVTGAVMLNGEPVRLSVIVLPASDSFGRTKSGQYVFEQLTKLIDDVGVRKVAVVCMDGASNCMAAMELISEHFPTIFTQRCAVHAWSLVLSDVAKVIVGGRAVFSDDIVAVLQVVAFVMNHSSVHDMLKAAAGLALTKPAGTRMASTCIAVERYLKDNQLLQQLVVSPAMVTEASRAGQTTKFKAGLLKAKTTINDDAMTERLQLFTRTCEPALKALRALDSKRANLCEAAYVNHLVRVSWRQLEDDDELRDALLRILEGRKLDVVTPLATVAAGLSVYCIYGDLGSSEMPLYLKDCKPWQPEGWRDCMEALVAKYFSGHPDADVTHVCELLASIARCDHPFSSAEWRKYAALGNRPFWMRLYEKAEYTHAGEFALRLVCACASQSQVESENKKVANLFTPHRNSLKSVTLQRLRAVANAEEVDYTPVEAWPIPPVINLVQEDAQVSMMQLMLNGPDDEDEDENTGWASLLAEAVFDPAPEQPTSDSESDDDLDDEAAAANSTLPDADLPASESDWGAEALPYDDIVPELPRLRDPALSPEMPIHICDDSTESGAFWNGPSDKRQRLCYYCHAKLHRNHSKSDAMCNKCFSARWKAGMPRLGCASHCGYCSPTA